VHFEEPKARKSVSNDKQNQVKLGLDIDQTANIINTGGVLTDSRQSNVELQRDFTGRKKSIIPRSEVF
jgi:hypothetical protein